MATEQAKIPDDNADWSAIDIFIFSNGQQYSPPRKYHITVAEVDRWESTLSLLAQTQTGSLNTSIDLYTLDGKKVCSPLELRNGSSYVAVEPPDKYIDSGYDKYLLRATRSWEKRQAKKADNNNVAELDESERVPQMGHNGVTIANINNQQQSPEDAGLKMMVPSMVVDETSMVVKPQPLSIIQRTQEQLQTTTAKPVDRKKASNQRFAPPTFIRKITPPLTPAPNIKPLIKKREIVRANNVKITRPVGDRNSYSAPGNIQTNKLPTKSKIYKPLIKPNEFSIASEAVLSNVPETGRLNISTPIEISSKNDRNSSTCSIDVKNAIEDKEIVMVSNLYQNLNREMPSVAINPYQVPFEPMKSHTSTGLLEANNRQKTTETINSDMKLLVAESSKEIIQIHDSPVRHSITNNKISNDQYVLHQVDGNESRNNQVVKNSSEIYKKIKMSSPLPEVHHSIMTNKHSNNQHEYNKNSEFKQNTANDPIKLYVSPPLRPSIINDKISDVQRVMHNIVRQVEDDMSNDVKVNSPKSNENIKTHNLTPTLHSNTTVRPLDDQYVAVLNRGDVVNLKLNIEIQNYRELPKLDDKTENLHSPSKILHTEKASQINFTNQIITQNKSLLSKLTKEVNECYKSDNHHIIIFKCDSSKYCNATNDQNVAMPDKDMNKNYAILVPVHIIEEDINGPCCCEQSQPKSRISSISNPVKATNSCMSMQRVSKPSQAEFPATISRDITTPCFNTDEHTIEKKSSEKDVIMVTRKKSVAISESTPTTRESSKITQESDIRTEFITVSMESLKISRNNYLNNSTQTEWCNVVLEARLLEDGHYSFHLPALETVKYYNL